jgi:hypothetical protein
MNAPESLTGHMFGRLMGASCVAGVHSAQGKPFSREDRMKKLRLNLDRLAVESFAVGADAGGKGTVEAHQATECSCAFTCGVASRGQEGYAEVPNTRYACCV